MEESSDPILTAECGRSWADGALIPELNSDVFGFGRVVSGTMDLASPLDRQYL
jgi:hypothetical protein